jgi:hypothetical protein
MAKHTFCRVTTAARVDVIGRMMARCGDYMTITVENWTPNGCSWSFTAHQSEFELSNAKAARDAADRR